MKHRVYYLILIITALTACNGCLGASKGVYLLPEERIFTLKAGSLVKLQLDNKPIDITFPTDMKVVHPNTLIRQEEKLNSETLKKMKAEKSKNNIMKMAGSILAIMAGLIGMLAKKKKK